MSEPEFPPRQFPIITDRASELIIFGGIPVRKPDQPVRIFADLELLPLDEKFLGPPPLPVEGELFG